MPRAGEIGVSIVRQFLAFLTGVANPGIDQAASILGACWCKQKRRADQVLNAVLILTLDHEVNVSSFTARVVASAGSNLYDVVNAAMCAFSGSRHGLASVRAEQFVRELELAETARSVIHERLPVCRSCTGPVRLSILRDAADSAHPFFVRITISTRRLSCCSSTDLSPGTIRRVLP
jgi:hypothetical protein